MSKTTPTTFLCRRKGDTEWTRVPARYAIRAAKAFAEKTHIHSGTVSVRGHGHYEIKRPVIAQKAA